MSITIQSCGIILMISVIYMYQCSRQLPLRSNRVFQASLYLTLIGLLLDVASTLGIVYSNRLPALLPVFLCKTHVASLLVIVLMAMAYVFTSVMYHLPSYQRTIVVTSIAGALMVGLIYLLPLALHFDPVSGKAWIEGPSTMVAYVGVFAGIVFNLIQLRRYRKHIYDRQFHIVIVWMCMWIAAALIQFIYEDLMAVGFASALGIHMVFVQFENPELYLDRTTGLFNAFAYQRYLEQLYREGGEFSVISVNFAETPWKNKRQPSDSVEKSQQLYNAFLNTRGAYVFKIQENEIVMVFPDVKAARQAWDMMPTRRDWSDFGELPNHLGIYYLPDSRCVNSPEEILELLQYVDMRKSNAQEKLFHMIDHAMVEQFAAERTTEQMIRDALAENRVVVYYQPIYSVDHKRFTSAEALVRIVDREGKLVPPGAFIQVAESNGMIIELGKRVFEKACQFYQSYDLERHGVEYIEVNLSVAQCADTRLSEDYISIMESTGINPRHINLEITESTSAREKQTLISHMERMIGCGVSFSLDDFGSGASNLNYIMDMPVQIIKFDKGMTQAYFSSDKAKYVMEAAMHMIHGLGLEIVAEGVETEEQYRKMEEMKINSIQGYYFSKPLPEREFVEFLQQANREALCPSLEPLLTMPNDGNGRNLVTIDMEA